MTTPDSDMERAQRLALKAAKGIVGASIGTLHTTELELRSICRALIACRETVARALTIVNRMECQEDCNSNVDRCQRCGEEFDAHPNSEQGCAEFEVRPCDCDVSRLKEALLWTN